MPERFLVFPDGVQVHASRLEPKRITVLDGELTEGKTGEITEPVLLVADRAFVAVESLQPGSVKPSVKAHKPRRAASKAKTVSGPPKAPPKRGSRSKASAKR